MAGRFGLYAIALLVLTFGAAEQVAAEVKPALNRPGVFEVGEPLLISGEGLRREMDRNSALREYIDAYGWPDYAEVQNMVVQEPLAPYEVRIYYLQRNEEHAFVRVNVAPTFQNFGIRKYQGSIAPQTIDRLLTVRAAMEAPPPAPEPAAVVEAVEAPVALEESAPEPAAAEAVPAAPSSAPAEEVVPPGDENPATGAEAPGAAESL